MIEKVLIGWTMTRSNIVVVEEGIKAAARVRNLDSAEAVDYLAECITRDRAAGEKIDRFYIEHGKYEKQEQVSSKNQPPKMDLPNPAEIARHKRAELMTE